MSPESIVSNHFIEERDENNTKIKWCELVC